ncbi:polyamine aminopropyltransferase, partial [Myxococcota bacterium]|nr:polyamine aminopropyltransferase [Myxococcota bacterium]
MHSIPEKPEKSSDSLSGSDPNDRLFGAVLMGSVFVVATCGIIYELLAAALSTYLVGNSITQFSIVIGIFLSAMGLGSYLSAFIKKELLRTFLLLQIIVGVVGGSSALILFFAFAALQVYQPFLILMTLATGTLVGLEIPLLVRILKTKDSLEKTLGNVLALDYVGALFASILFPLVLLPWLGLVRTSFVFGLLNILVALLGVQLFASRIRGALFLKVLATVFGLILLTGAITAGKTTSLLEDILYDDDVIFAKTTPYQRLVITKWRSDVRLFINGNIQFSSVDEFRYHESLVHPAMSLLQEPKSILILGGGDGMVAREVLKYSSVDHVDLVDLDPAMTRIFSELPLLAELNKGALKNPKVHVHNADAQIFMETTERLYDLILIDLPDPKHEGLGKLYSTTFYRLTAKNLTPRGILVTQATSPYYA